MRDHKSLEAWRQAHIVVNATIDLAESHWRPSLRAVYNQLSSAALSVQLNIAEGYALATRPLFIRHIRIAYGSAIEVGDLLELLAERKAVPAEIASPVLHHCNRCQRLLLGLLRQIPKDQ